MRSLHSIAVTGITSGVGVRFAEMAAERGLAIRGMVRDPNRADAKRLLANGVELVKGDLDDGAALLELGRGADVFFHFAAAVGDTGDAAEFVRVNVGGTRRALEAAAKAGVKRFVHLSSTAVYGRPDSGRVDETWPMKRTGVPYDDTKQDAEKLAFSLGAKLGLEVTAVRPPIIYGPYDRNFMPRAAEALRKGRYILISGGRAPLNVVSVDHVVEVLLLAGARDEAVGEAFNVMDEVDGKCPTVKEIGATIADAIGAPRPKVSLPFPVAMAIGHAVERGFQLAKSKKTPPLSPFVVRILTRDVIYDSSKAAKLLGWQPKVRALDGVAAAAREFASRSNGA